MVTTGYNVGVWPNASMVPSVEVAPSAAPLPGLMSPPTTDNGGTKVTLVAGEATLCPCPPLSRQQRVPRRSCHVLFARIALCRAVSWMFARATLRRAVSCLRWHSPCTGSRGLTWLPPLRTGVVSATAFGILAFGAVVFWWCLRRRRRQGDSDAGSEIAKRVPSTPDLEPPDWKAVSQPSRGSPQGSNNYKDLVGNGTRNGLELTSVDSTDNGGVSPTSSTSINNLPE